MKTLSMTGYNRPIYMKQTLDQISSFDFSDFERLEFALEPGHKDVEKVARGVSFVNTKVYINPGKLGVKNNPYKLLSRVFDGGSELNIYLEDDVLFSPDILRLAKWYSEIPDVNQKYYCMSFFRKELAGDLSDIKVESDPKYFSALGLVMTKYQWENFFKKCWHLDKRGWDWSVKESFKKSGKKFLVPAVSRSYHIGRDNATHYVPAIHDKVHLNVKWNKDEYDGEYRIIE